MITVGIDPDVHDCAIAWWNAEGPLGAGVVHARRSEGNSAVQMAREIANDDDDFEALFHDDVKIVAIEGQQVDGRKARPRDLFTLAHVTGAALLWSCLQYPHATILVPTPTEWKGGVAKHAMQARLYHDIGWGYEIAGSGRGRYARPLKIPLAFDHITPGQWRHVGDALLLARWAYNQ